MTHREALPASRRKATAATHRERKPATHREGHRHTHRKAGRRLAWEGRSRSHREGDRRLLPSRADVPRREWVLPGAWSVAEREHSIAPKPKAANALPSFGGA
jgi:hypothetical protein